MRAINEVVAFVLLLLFMVLLLAIIFPYYIQAGKKSAEMTTAASQPTMKQIQASVIILDVEPYANGNATCVVIKNTGAVKLSHFKLYFVYNSSVIQFNYDQINITDLCTCEYGAPSDTLDPGTCGYLIMPVNYSIIKGRTLYLVSDYDTSSSYIVG